MRMIEHIQLWGSHHPKWLIFLRIALGLTLLCKGILFISDFGALTTFLRETGISDQIGTSVFITTAAQLIIILHILGGVCITLGVQTRLFCILNLPALIGAVFFVNIKQHSAAPYPEFLLSLVVLLALTGLLVSGGETYSTTNETDEPK